MTIYVNYKLLRARLMDVISQVGNIAQKLGKNSTEKWNINFKKFYDNMCDICDIMKIDVIAAVRAKMILNDKKYPADLAHGTVKKYTEYTESTKISKTKGQEINDDENINRQLITERNKREQFYDNITKLTKQAFEFSTKRSIEHYDTTTNLMLALTAEMGELCEIFIWKGDTDEQTLITKEEWDNAAKEIADVIIYAMKLFCKIIERNETLDIAD